DVEGRGPLQGLLAGLTALGGLSDAAYLSSCDVPFLRPDFVRRVIGLLGDHDIAVPRAAGYHHPLAAIYRLGVRPAVERLLRDNRLRPVFLFESVPTREIGPEELSDVDPTLRSLRNLNTPADHEAALSELGTKAEGGGSELS